MRRVVIGGNWKMNKSSAEAKEFFQKIKPLLKNHKDIDVYIYPPFTLIPLCVELAQGTNIKIGGQNVNNNESGAYTGDISAAMLTDSGCTSTIIGHSERRHVFLEPDSFMSPKLKATFASHLTPVYCIGEKIEEREAGKTEEVLDRQLSTGLEGITKEQMETLVIAYEPVWAIGTGKSATKDDAQKACSYIRNWIKNKYGDDIANTIPIQYGGSVKPENFAEYIACPDIDGALIGGAALKHQSFADILNFKR